MKNNITFVGLDVHKDSIDVALADADHDGDVRFFGTIGGDLDSLDGFFFCTVHLGLNIVANEMNYATLGKEGSVCANASLNTRPS